MVAVKVFVVREHSLPGWALPVAGGTLADAIAFNSAHADVEMPYFNQDIFDLCNSMAPGPDDPQPAFGGVTYNQALKADQDFTVNNVDAAISAQHLDAIVSASRCVIGASNRHTPRRVS